MRVSIWISLLLGRAVTEIICRRDVWLESEARREKVGHISLADVAETVGALLVLFKRERGVIVVVLAFFNCFFVIIRRLKRVVICENFTEKKR